MKFKVSILCILAFLYLLSGSGLSFAQTSADLITSKLKAYTNSHTSEKVYLQFDKPYYAAGDTIYFKAYLTMGERHNLSILSGVLHVNLINTANKIDKSIKLQVVSGVTWGDFTLADSLPPGNYRVRAYTNWMRNEGEDAFFEKVIPVGSIHPQKIPESNTAKAIQGKADLQFFPEGGELVAGINSRIAFKAIGANGLGIAVTGTVSDNTGKKVAEIQSTHLGMGYFNLVPEQGRSYRASVTYADGSKDAIPLPQADNNGITLSVNNDSLQKASVKVEANKAYYDANKGKGYTILIWSGGYVATVNCKLDSPVIKMDIIKRRLFTGVTRITLFSAENEPLCERLIFIQKFDQLNLDINPDKSNYKTRDHVIVALNAKTRADSSVIGHFSVSVTDDGKVQQDEDSESTILTNLLLTSDLKGYVEQPNYYFTGINDEKLRNLDLVMLTHGYRRFTWKQVLDTVGSITKYPVEAGLCVKGIAENLLGKPIAKARVALLSAQSKGFITDTADNKGQFHFDNLMFTDSAKFILQAVNAKGKSNTKLIYQRNENIPSVIPFVLRQQQDTAAMSAYMSNTQKEQEITQKFGSVRGKMLKEVHIKAKPPRPTVNTLYGMADQVINGDQIPFSGNGLSIHLMTLTNGITWGFAGGNRFIPYLLRNTAPPRRASMTIVWNNNEMDPSFDVNQIREPIDSIIVIRDEPLHPEGVLMFFTSGGLRPRDIAATGILPITVKGFYKAREFYSPRYDASLPSNTRPDLRSTIYWNPALITGKDGNASFDFYSADTPGNYRVVMEGIDSKGNIGRKVVFIKVD